MGMGHSPCSAYKIELESIRTIVPAALSHLEGLLLAYGMKFEEKVDWDSFCQFSRFEDEAAVEEAVQEADQSLSEEESGRRVAEIIESWNSLQTAFCEATKVSADDAGLQLYASWHDSNMEGSRYDEVDGGFFTVDGARTWSPAGEKYKDVLEHVAWVAFC